MHITIFWEIDGLVTMRAFTSDGEYDTEDEADVHGPHRAAQDRELKIWGEQKVRTCLFKNS